MTVTYPASGGYVAYRYRHDAAAARVELELTGSGDACDCRVLLPAGATGVAAVTVGGRRVAHVVLAAVRAGYRAVQVRESERGVRGDRGVEVHACRSEVRVRDARASELEAISRRGRTGRDGHHLRADSLCSQQRDENEKAGHRNVDVGEGWMGGSERLGWPCEREFDGAAQAGRVEGLREEAVGRIGRRRVRFAAHQQDADVMRPRVGLECRGE